MELILVRTKKELVFLTKTGRLPKHLQTLSRSYKVQQKWDPSQDQRVGLKKIFVTLQQDKRDLKLRITKFMMIMLNQILLNSVWLLILTIVKGVGQGNVKKKNLIYNIYLKTLLLV